MKRIRILLTMAMMMVAIGAMAQFTNSGGSKSSSSKMLSSSEMKYQGDFAIADFMGDANVFTFGTTNGVRIDEIMPRIDFFAGIGLWCEIESSSKFINLAPLVSFKGYYAIKDEIKAFFSPEFGVSIGVAGSETYSFHGYEMKVENSGSHFEYRMSVGVEFNSFFVGLGCGGAGQTAFYLVTGFTW